MSRVLITGSADGLGLMAAQSLATQGHQVVLHARNTQRARVAQAAVPLAKATVIGDLSSSTQTRSVAEQVNRLGRMDAVIHNAAVGYREPRVDTEDGLPNLFAINTLAPYILTALIDRPQRLVYVSSNMHLNAKPNLQDLTWQQRRWQAAQAYAESKLHNVLLAFAIARMWPNVLSNALHPGWVPTKMGGAGAPDDLAKGWRTQAWLAVSDDVAARVSGEYFFHQRVSAVNPVTRDARQQDLLIATCKTLSGVALPP
jgi:NAD(P)-dependent dehydrogenase (short-subunit alcohol dehydrogenase family)